MDGVLDREKIDFLLKVARLTIEKQLVDKVEIPETSDLELLEKSGTFVTLKIGGQLRGCIGNLEPVKTIYGGIRDNALNAAFYDHRFSRLTVEELGKVRISISILTPPQPLSYRDGDDLLEKLRPGVDGVILRLGKAGSTFLPQVWQQLPKAERFLGHLCLKAGLTETAWRDSHPEIEIYQVQNYEEDKE